MECLRLLHDLQSLSVTHPTPFLTHLFKAFDPQNSRPLADSIKYFHLGGAESADWRSACVGFGDWYWGWDVENSTLAPTGAMKDREGSVTQQTAVSGGQQPVAQYRLHRAPRPITLTDTVETQELTRISANFQTLFNLSRRALGRKKVELENAMEGGIGDVIWVEGKKNYEEEGTKGDVEKVWARRTSGVDIGGGMVVRRKRGTSVAKEKSVPEEHEGTEQTSVENPVSNSKSVDTAVAGNGGLVGNNTISTADQQIEGITADTRQPVATVSSNMHPPPITELASTSAVPGTHSIPPTPQPPTRAPQLEIPPSVPTTPAQIYTLLDQITDYTLLTLTTAIPVLAFSTLLGDEQTFEKFAGMEVQTVLDWGETWGAIVNVVDSDIEVIREEWKRIKRDKEDRKADETKEARVTGDVDQAEGDATEGGPFGLSSIDELRDLDLRGRGVDALRIGLRAVIKYQKHSLPAKNQKTPKPRYISLPSKLSLLHTLVSLSLDTHLFPPTIVAHKAAVKCLQPSIFDTALWGSAGYDGVVRIWDWREVQSQNASIGGKTKDTKPDKGAIEKQSEFGGVVGLHMPLSQYPIHKSIVTSLHFTPTNQHLVTTSFDRLCKITSAQSATTERVLAGHTDALTSSSLSPDSRYVATGSIDCSIRLWDFANGNCIAVVKKHLKWVKSVVFSADGRYLISAGLDKKIYVWDVKILCNASSISHTRLIEGCEDYILDLATARPSVLASTCRDGKVRLHDYMSGQQVWEYDMDPLWGCCLDFNYDGKWLAIGCFDGSVSILDAKSGKRVRVIRCMNSGVACLRWSREGSYICVGTQEGWVQMVLL
ncbi:hypothetical protein HDU85_004975 [Gaertneriomyces sp. JEL0708]|nr:hypothetical protein HDU85_004975 [Gaertneriomyces sp. JEL0708]